VREVRVDLARMRLSALAHEGEQSLGALPSPRAHAAGDGARVHQRLVRARQESVVDEEVFLDGELRVLALDVARAVALDAVPERQILRACWRADRVGLYEAEAFDGALQRGRREQAARHRVAAQLSHG
jgi:hypothetical protein